MIETTDVCIIGGGIQGCAAALELARCGVKVIVIERNYPGKQASGVNAGGVRRMNRALAEIPLSLAAHEIWCDIGSHVGDDCGFIQTNNIKIAETSGELNQINARLESLTANGYTHEQVLTPNQVQTYLPNLKLSIAGALFCQGDGFASPFKTTHAFFIAAQKAGAKFCLGESVISLKKHSNWCITTDRRKLEARVILNCAGAWGNHIAKMVGDPQVVIAEAPMMSITEPVAPVTQSVIGFVGRKLSFKQRQNGTLLIGGGYRGYVNPDGRSARINIEALSRNFQTVVAIFPHLANVKIVRSWAGVEGMTPDNLPIIGVSPRHNSLFHAFGFSAHGFQLGPIVGRILKDLVVNQHSNLPIEPFNIDRFQK